MTLCSQLQGGKRALLRHLVANAATLHSHTRGCGSTSHRGGNQLPLAMANSVFLPLSLLLLLAASTVSNAAVSLNVVRADRKVCDALSILDSSFLLWLCLLHRMEFCLQCAFVAGVFELVLGFSGVCERVNEFVEGFVKCLMAYVMCVMCVLCVIISP